MPIMPLGECTMQVERKQSSDSSSAPRERKKEKQQGKRPNQWSVWYLDDPWWVCNGQRSEVCRKLRCRTGRRGTKFVGHRVIAFNYRVHSMGTVVGAHSIGDVTSRPTCMHRCMPAVSMRRYTDPVSMRRVRYNFSVWISIASQI